MAVTIYLARHAEAANPRNILYGRLPRVDLSIGGRDQATALADAMAELPLDAIYHSPLLRARRTALAIAARHPGAPLHESSLLLENRHPYQGRTNAEVAKLGDRAYDADVLGTDGETIQDVRDRLARFLRLVARRHTGRVVAAVSHADPIAALRAHLLGLDLTVASLRKEAPPLASVFRLEFSADETPQLEWFWKPPAPPPAPPAASDNGAKGDQSDPGEAEPGVAAVKANGAVESIS